MPREKQPKQLCVEDLRHAEYYGLQKTFDELYARSKKGKIFTDLMELILSRENILLAYLFKSRGCSKSPGKKQSQMPTKVVQKALLFGSAPGGTVKNYAQNIVIQIENRSSKIVRAQPLMVAFAPIFGLILLLNNYSLQNSQNEIVSMLGL